jgi:hypothetical protein
MSSANRSSHTADALDHEHLRARVSDAHPGGCCLPRGIRAILAIWCEAWSIKRET